MHIEIDRVTDEDELAAIEARLQRVLRDIRDAVEDWPRMQAKLAEIVAELEAAPPTLPDPTELGRGTDFLRWLADDHFAFLGYREYSLVEDGDELALQRGPGDRARHPARRPAAVLGVPEAARGGARARPRAARCSCWPRPTPRPPCTGRPTSTTSGSRSSTRTTRSSGSAGSSGCSPSATYTESVLRIPALREKVDEVLERARHRRRAATPASSCSTCWRTTRATSSSSPRSTS